MSTEGFIARSLYLAGGLLVWAANFLLTYVFTALACARGFAHHTVAGVGLVPLVTVASSLLAAGGCLLLLRRGLASRQRGFIDVTAAMVALLSLIATGWTALVAAVPIHC